MENDALPGVREDALLGVVVEAAAVRAAEPALARRERQQAIRDLLDTGSFRPQGLEGPFLLRLRLARHRLVFEVRNHNGARLRDVAIAIGPLRQAIRDYGMIVAAHRDAVAAGSMARIQAIDALRRTLHDELACRLADRLHDEVAVDHATARRLLTLVHVVAGHG
jgi:uncharacterized protein (UPF0262 family)